ncbi:hypothetical protein B1C78_00140 [Thioalkalivibrio denitrificans]|uniref:Relaxase n=1 Tax=Thioalkalivibrio denitrificans TaxID=108003 RepID=A0A1V3NVJ0_9GAMM|nr:hypothetical protein B1C78_00140 [Thioalkalivibrio denitrificans]
MLRRIRGQRSPPSRGSRDGLIPVQTAASLLQPTHRQAILNQIASLTSLPPQHYAVLMQQAIERYGRFVQQLPASEAHHHANLGGMLDHGLEVLTKALRLRQGHILPPGAEAEKIAKLADLWTYAVATAALLHDLGKPAVDQTVTLYDSNGRRLARWDPWSGPMDQVAACTAYTVEYRRDRRHRFHERATPLLVHHILPREALSWIASDPEVFSCWLAAISGAADDAGILGQIVLQADGESVAANLCAGPSERAVRGRAKSLWERLLTGLRFLISEGDLPLNRNGAAGWLVGDELWLVSKRTIDALRGHLTAEGHSGIPSSNDRVYDTLQEHGILMPNKDRAIWRATVAGDGWRHDLTLIRIPAHRIWPDPATRPSPFDGEIIPITDVDEGAEQTQGPAEMVAGTDEPGPIAQPAALPSPYEPPPATKKHEEAASHDAASLERPDPTFPGNVPCPDVPTIASAKAPARANDPLDGRDPNDAGVRFVQWVRHGLVTKRISVNNANARVHTVPEGVLLVSPGLFKDFSSEAGGESWEHVQKRFAKFKLHEKLPDGTNIHRYRVSGPRRQSSIKGFMVADPGLIFDGPAPAPNKYLQRADSVE